MTVPLWVLERRDYGSGWGKQGAREYRDMRNVFTQEGRGFPAFKPVSTSRLSAFLEGLSGDMSRLCGCISLEPGVCSFRHEQADSPSTGKKYINANTVHSGDLMCSASLIV